MLPRLENLRKNSNADARSQQFLRALASRSELVAWDAQGRIRIKDDLLAYASIENQVMLSGTFNKFDLWNPEQWKEQIGSIDLSTFEEDAARFAGY
jgi:MraZ protein